MKKNAFLTLALGLMTSFFSLASGLTTANATEQKIDQAAQMSRAAMNNDVEAITGFVEAGFAVDAADERGRTALMIAARKQHMNLVKYLWILDADLNRQDKTGMTALMIAAKNNDLRMFRYLIAKGADVSLKNNDGHTAFEIARGRGYVQLTRIHEAS